MSELSWAPKSEFITSKIRPVLTNIPRKILVILADIYSVKKSYFSNLLRAVNTTWMIELIKTIITDDIIGKL
jgi:hypothetical protein